MLATRQMCLSSLIIPCVQVFSLVTFICATVWHEFVPLGGGWVQFVSMLAFILTTFLYMLYAFRLTSKLSEQIPFKFTVSVTDTQWSFNATFLYREVLFRIKTGITTYANT